MALDELAELADVYSTPAVRAVAACARAWSYSPKGMPLAQLAICATQPRCFAAQKCRTRSHAFADCSLTRCSPRTTGSA